MKILSVNRNFYLFGIFFATLQLFLNVFQSILYTQVGLEIRFLRSFPVWFLILNLTTFCGLLILMKYYEHKKYRSVLITATLFGAASFCHAAVIYFMLTAQRLESYFVDTYNAYLLTSVLYGICLIFSGTRKRFWLRVAGTFILVLAAGLTIFFLWQTNTPDFELRQKLDKIHTAISMLGGVLPLPFIMNFYDELKEMGGKREKPYPAKTAKASFLAMIVLILIPSILLTRDSVENRLYQKAPSEQARRMAEPFEARTFTNAQGEILSYRLLKPLNYNPQKKYPLAVCLHHGGGNGIENIVQIQASEWAQTLADPVNREKYPAFIFVPQCPPGSSFGGLPNYPEISDLVFEAIAELEKEFAIDEKRRYVMGVSLGGFGSWHFIGTRPKIFAAAMPVCGGGDPDHAQNMVNIPIWAFHGAKDSNVPVILSRTMIARIRKLGGKPRYSEFENEGHAIWGKVRQTPDKLEWLFAQRKK